MHGVPFLYEWSILYYRYTSGPIQNVGFMSNNKREWYVIHHESQPEA
jgi:hypothetical protein